MSAAKRNKPQESYGLFCFPVSAFSAFMGGFVSSVSRKMNRATTMARSAPRRSAVADQPAQKITTLPTYDFSSEDNGCSNTSRVSLAFSVSVGNLYCLFAHGV